MGKIRIYEYPKCSTCQKAIRYLSGKKIEPERVDITQSPPSRPEIEAMVKLKGGEVKKLFNTSGLVYREMKLGDRLKDLAPSEAIRLLAENGRLIKRPFLLHAGQGLLGFKEAEWDKVFG